MHASLAIVQTDTRVERVTVVVVVAFVPEHQHWGELDGAK
jgi:hypothetical protein